MEVSSLHGHLNLCNSKGKKSRPRALVLISNAQPLVYPSLRGDLGYVTDTTMSLESAVKINKNHRRYKIVFMHMICKKKKSLYKKTQASQERLVTLER